MEKRVIYSDSTITVIMADGDIFSAENADMDMYQRVMELKEKKAIMNVMFPEMLREEKAAMKEREVYEHLTKGITALEETGDFICIGNEVQMCGIERSLPISLVHKLVEVVEGEGVESAQYIGLKRFWQWCCLNPRAEVADTLFDFFEKNFMRINSQGMFYALRNVVSCSKDQALVLFISKEYTRLKLAKHNPKEYSVWRAHDGTYYTEHATFTEVYVSKIESMKGVLVGNLQDLYLELPTMAQNRFTDAYTKSFDIRIGQRVYMDPAKCSWSTRDCAEAGLHFTMNQIHQVGCGDTTIVVLINPMKVVGIGTHKGRCYEYLPLCIVPRDEALDFLETADFDTAQMEAQFIKEELNGLAELAKENFAKEAKKHSFNIPKMDNEQLRNIVLDLQKCGNEIASRVVVFGDQIDEIAEEYYDGYFGHDYDYDDEVF